MTPAPLRLLAADEEDLKILAAAAQDAVFTVADASWLPAAGRFTVTVQRFRWEAAGARAERVRAVLSFDRVRSVKARKVAQSRRDGVASLLSVSFAPGAEAPEGVVTLELADGGAIALEVECVDAVLADLGAPRDAVGRPDHG